MKRALFAIEKNGKISRFTAGRGGPLRYFAESALPTLIQQHNEEANVYTGLYSVRDRWEYVKGQGDSVAYSGDVVIDRDFHEISQYDQASQDVRRISQYFTSLGIEHLIYFTGRGYNIRACSGHESNRLPWQHKRFCQLSFSELNIDHHPFIPPGLTKAFGSKIYYANGRYSYKDPVPLDLVGKPIKEIIDFLQDPIETPDPSPSSVLRDRLEGAEQQFSMAHQHQRSVIKQMHRTHHDSQTQLNSGICEPSTRHDSTLTIAIHLKLSGMSKSSATDQLLDYSTRLQENQCTFSPWSEIECDIHNIINWVYSTHLCPEDFVGRLRKTYRKCLRDMLRSKKHRSQKEKAKVFAAFKAASKVCGGRPFFLPYSIMRKLGAHPCSNGRNFVHELIEENKLRIAAPYEVPGFDPWSQVLCYQLVKLDNSQNYFKER